MNSPATFAASPTANQSPASAQGAFDVGANGISGKKKPAPPGLSVDVEGAAAAQPLDGVEMTPVSAVSTTTATGTGKKKSSGKKAAAKSKKGAAASTASTVKREEDFAIPSTPTHVQPGSQGQEMLYNPQAGAGGTSMAMSRSGTHESIGVAPVELGTPVGSHSAMTPQHPPPAQAQHSEMDTLSHSQTHVSAPMADGSNGPSMQDLAGVDDEMFNNLFASYTEGGHDDMPLSANMLNFDDYNVGVALPSRGMVLTAVEL